MKAKRRERGLEYVRSARQLVNEYSNRPVLRALCERNLALAEEASGGDGVISRLRAAMERRRSQEALLAQLKEDYVDMQARVQLVGQSQAIGSLLLAQLDTLPSRYILKNQLAASQQELTDAKFGDLELREQLRDARRDGPAMQQALSILVPKADGPEAQSVRRDLRRILAQREELLTELSHAYAAYQRELAACIAAEQGLLKVTEEFTVYIEERVLWVRSMPALGLSDFSRAVQAIADLVGPTAREGIWKDVQEDLAALPVASVAALLGVVALFVGQVRMRRRIRAIGRDLHEHPPGTFRATLETCLWTALSALAWPALFWVISWRLTARVPSAEISIRLSNGLAIVSYWLLWACAVREVCLPDGLGDAHLKMDRARLASLRRAMRVFAVAILPLVFLGYLTTVRPTSETLLSLGRLADLAWMLTVGVLGAVLLRRSGPLVCGEDAEESRGPLRRTWWLWYTASVLGVLVLVALSVTGFYYTAREIVARVLTTVFLLLLYHLVRGMASRGLMLLRRQMVRQEVRKGREAEEEADTDRQKELENNLLRETVMQVTEVSQQTAQIVKYLLWGLMLVAMYAVWDDLLPAFRAVGRIHLYSVGETQVVLGDMIVAAVAAVLTFATARVVPGMLDVYVLGRTEIDASARDAIASITRYLLVIVGVVIVGESAGLNWASLQWIVAALGVGLGFGLQEIVANFVSGLVIMFERRVRLWDIVTVGDETGQITAIRTFATTITNWDNKELVIPNKEFITGRVINWTLSEKRVRVVIPVGVAYGSDTEKVVETLVRVGNANQYTLDDPPVRAVFLGFGDSCLNFQLHIWVPNIDHFLDVRHELHMAVDQAFREADITIAFPQLDVHFDAPVPDSGGR